VALKSVPSRDTSSRGDVRRRHRGGPLTRSGCSPVRRAMGRHSRFDSKIFESAHRFRIESGGRFEFESNQISKLRRSLCFTVFFHNLSPSSLWSISWPGTLHFILHTSPNHYLLFATHVHTIATCFAVVPRLCHLILVFLSTLYLELYLVTSHHTPILPFSSLPSEVTPHFVL